MVLFFSRKEPKALALRGSDNPNQKLKLFVNAFREAEQTLLVLFWKRRIYRGRRVGFVLFQKRTKSVSSARLSQTETLFNIYRGTAQTLWRLYRGRRLVLFFSRKEPKALAQSARPTQTERFP
jgi:hypothetical protein